MLIKAEVRNLASRSAEAAKEIKAIGENATRKADEGKDIANHMINEYKKLNEDIQQTVKLISDVEMSSREQLLGIEQINDSINSLDKQTQENVNIANITHAIAQNTLEITQTIVKNTNTKKFDEECN